MKCVCPMGGDRTCPDDCTPARRAAFRKTIAETLYGQDHTMAQIATQLGVSEKTISLDLKGVLTPGKNPPRPKGGRPKGSKRPAGERPQDPVRIDATPEEWEDFKERVAEEGTTAAAKLGELIKEPEIDPATLSKTAQQKLQTAIRQQMQKLGAEFYKRVDARCHERMNEYWLPEHKKLIADAKRVMDSRKGIMTKTKFDLIRSALHPDSRKSITDKKLTDAFREFMALEKMLLEEKESPSRVSDLPERWEDWEKMRRSKKPTGTKGGNRVVI